MKKYGAIMKSQLQIYAQYTSWYWAEMFSKILSVLILFYFWHAVYANVDEVGNMNLYTMLTYVIIANILNDYMRGAGSELGNLVRDGNIGLELIRPYDIFLKFMVLDFGGKVASFFQGTIPVLVISFLFLGIQGPANITTFLLFLVSAILGILIGSQLDLIVGILAFWFRYIWGLMMLKTALFSFFAGALIPISLFPDWLARISEFLPFKYMVYVPVSIYTGQITGSIIYFYLFMQVVWFVLIYFGIRLMWRRALKNVTINGG